MDEQATLQEAALILTRGHSEADRMMILGAMIELSKHGLGAGVGAKDKWLASLRALGETCITIANREQRTRR